MSQKNPGNNRGLALLYVILILLTIALIGASLVAFFSLVNLSVRTTVEEVKAFYLAEAGIAHAINVLRQGTGVLTGLENKIGPVFLGEGTYEVDVDPYQSLIISTGRVGDTKKVLQLHYSSL